MNVSLLDKIIIFLIPCLFLIGCLILSYYFLNDAWIEWKLSEELRKEGIPTQAIVQSCIRRRGNCNTTYQYEVPSSGQQIQTYTVRESGCDCRKGELITIFYLPDNPSQARLYTNKYINSLIYSILSSMFTIGIYSSFAYDFFIGKKLFSLYEKEAKKIRSGKKRAVIELLLFILIFTLPGFIFGLFLDLIIFKEVLQVDEFIEMAEELIKIGIYASFLCIPYNLFEKYKLHYLYVILLFYLFTNLILGGRFWFIIQPLITLGARLAWILHDLRIYVWSLFWALITIWVVLCWIKLNIQDDVNPSESDDLAK